MNKNYTMSEVRKRYGGVGRSTIYRWASDPATGFPAPRKIGRRIMWHEADLEAFDASIAAPSSTAT